MSSREKWFRKELDPDDMEYDASDLIGKSYDSVGGCWGLCCEIAARRGSKMPYHDTPEDLDNANALFVHIKSKRFTRIERATPWCLVAFKIFHDGQIRWHAGTVDASGAKFVHVRKSTGVCKGRLHHPFWAESFEGFYDYTG